MSVFTFPESDRNDSISNDTIRFYNNNTDINDKRNYKRFNFRDYKDVFYNCHGQLTAEETMAYVCGA